MRRGDLGKYKDDSRPDNVLEEKRTPPRHRSNKDTRSWCHGKPGNSHPAYWLSWNYTFWGDQTMHVKHEELHCMVCRKVIQYRRSFWPGAADDEHRVRGFWWKRFHYL